MYHVHILFFLVAKIANVHSPEIGEYFPTVCGTPDNTTHGGETSTGKLDIQAKTSSVSPGLYNTSQSVTI